MRDYVVIPTASVLMLLVAGGGPSRAQEPVEIGTDKQLLFDDWLFAEKQGFVTTVNPAVREGRPLLVSEEPWEAQRIWWQNSVLQEADGTVKLWYNAFAEGDVRYLCLAVSKDGVRFTRPKLRLIEYQGSLENNIVFAGPPQRRAPQYGTVFLDPNADAEARFKMIFGARLLEKVEGTPAYQGIRGAYSPDGIHWTIYDAERIMPWYTDTQNVAFWDERIGKYVAYVRWNTGYKYVDHSVSGTFNYRAVGRSESDDFTSFPPPTKVLESPPEEHQRDGGYLGYMDLYNPPVVKLAPNAYFMFPSRFYHYGVSNKLDVGLAASHDGIHWTLFPDTFISLGADGEFDSERIYVAAGVEPVRFGRRLWLYYGGYDLDHGKTKPYPPKFGGIGRACVCIDGFVSQDAPASGGTILTRPFVVRGNRLLVNLDGSAGGYLSIEFLDETGQPIPKFSGEAAGLNVGNNVELVACMRNSKCDLSPLVGRTVQMRISGRNVKLYSFRFANTPPVEHVLPGVKTRATEK